MSQLEHGVPDGYGESWRARLGDGRTVLGAGIVVTRDTVLTCAHVVDRGATARVDFPGSSSRASVPATVRSDGWVPVDAQGGGDVALLALGQPPPPDVSPARLRRCGPVPGRRVRAYGHPDGMDGGVWARAELVGAGGPWPGWVQFDGVDSTGRAVAAGFSGAGVVDESGSVIGMVVATDRSAAARVSWMIPLEVAARQLPALASLLPSDEGPAASRVAPIQRLARALSAIPAVSDPTSREQIIAALPPQIARAIPRHPTLGMDCYNIVRTCADYDHGLAALARILDEFSPGSRQLRDFVELLTETGVDGM